MTLEELKTIKAAIDAYTSGGGPTQERRELLDRVAPIDLLATAIGIAEQLRQALEDIADGQGLMPAGEACECPDLAKAAIDAH